MKELIVAKEAAKAAGKLLLKYFGSTLETESKGKKDIVTNADKEAQELIIRMIHKAFPGDGIFAEESDNNKYSDGRLWVIDPLDGTINFSRGIPLFGVSIAFLEGGERRCGVIFLPCSEEMYSAEKGGGASLNDSPIRVSDISQTEKSVIALCEFNAGPTDKIRNLNLLKMDLYRRIHAESMRFKIFGSAVVTLAYIACGKIDAYIMLNINIWDIAAGTLIVEEAGGKVTDYQGQPIKFDPNCVLVTNGRLHEDYLRLVSKGNNSLQLRFESIFSL